jgi:hypothetical protein
MKRGGASHQPPYTRALMPRSTATMSTPQYSYCATQHGKAVGGGRAYFVL